MFDAYTIKKVMPRLLIATILIQLSWPLLTTFINVVSQISWGLEGLIYLPFGGRENLTIAKSLEGSAGNLTFNQILAGGGLWIGFGAPGLMGLAIGVLMVMLAAFFALAIRQVLIIILVITAPLAFVAWILPNTENLWKMWWGMLSKALMMYPLVLLIIAGGRIGAHLVGLSDLPQVINAILVIVVFFAPFFLVPKTFQFAGGVIGAVGGAISARGAKMSAWSNKRALAKQGRKMSERGAALKAGDYFKGRVIPKKYRGAVVDRLNNTTRRLGTGTKGRFGFGQAGVIATDNTVANRAAELMKTEAFAANSENDPVLQGAAAGRTEGEAIRNLQSIFGYSEERAKEIASQTRATIGFGAAEQMAAAQQLVATGTGYSNYDQMVSTLALASGGNSSTAQRLAGFANATTKKVGRSDLAPSFRNLNNDVHAAADIETRAGPAETPPLSDHAVQQVVAASRGADATTLIRGKPAQMEQIGEALTRHMYQQAEIVTDQTGAYTPEQVAAAQAELDISSQQVRELERASRMGYGSTINTGHVDTLVNNVGALLTRGELPIQSDDPNQTTPEE